MAIELGFVQTLEIPQDFSRWYHGKRMNFSRYFFRVGIFSDHPYIYSLYVYLYIDKSVYMINPIIL